MPKRPRQVNEAGSEFYVKRETEEVAIKNEDKEDEDIGHLGSESLPSPENKGRVSKRSKSSAGRVNNEGDTYFQLGPKKRITVRAWKGVPLVDIREYWKDDEDVEKPSKKGISLTADQFRDLLKYADEISNVLDSME